MDSFQKQVFKSLFKPYNHHKTGDVKAPQITIK